MIILDELENFAESKQEENLKFRRYLKNHEDEEELDNDFKELHKKFLKFMTVQNVEIVVGNLKYQLYMMN